mmetsp:Transcript_11344/g.21852  ORF Transcript_11344/g.21852 Transcript_11344/m.21852 type:complete len:109 (-) Transcript_11344:319-645(-)
MRPHHFDESWLLPRRRYSKKSRGGVQTLEVELFACWWTEREEKVWGALQQQARCCSCTHGQPGGIVGPDPGTQSHPESAPPDPEPETTPREILPQLQLLLLIACEQKP